MSKDLPRLFLVDTFGLIFRAFHARARSRVQAMRTSRGAPTEAIYMFNNMVNKLLEDYRPEHVTAVWEGRGPTFREKEYPEYKANRDETPDELLQQLPFIRRLLDCRNIQVVSEDGYEADDTIGLLAVQAASQGTEVWIVSSDKDLMQLVGDRVVLLDPMKKVEYRVPDVESFLGVRPEFVADYLALLGDKVDNIPGAPGIGKKGAQQLIGAYGHVERIIEHAQEVRRKSYRESLRNNAEQIRMSKRLATLDTSGSLRWDSEASRNGPPEAESLLDLYRELEFHSLANRMEAALGQEQVELNAGTFDSAETFQDWLGATSGPIAVAMAVDAAGRDDAAESDALGLAAKDGEAWRVPRELAQLAEDLFLDGEREIWIHDWKAAIHAIGGTRVQARAVRDDTMLMAFLIDSSRTNYSLAKTVERRLGTSCGDDPAVAAAHVRTLREQMGPEIDKMGLRTLYETIELPLIPVLARMEAAGIQLEKEVLEDLSTRLGDDIARLGGEIHDLAGRRFNIGSPKQLGEVLYGDLGLPAPRRKGKSKAPSTASDILQGLAAKHPIAGKVLDWRQVSKLRNTYVDVLPTLVADDGRLHTTFNPTGSATGRLSSLNPNLQNIPARTALGREIRKAFVAKEGCLLVAADYSQIELRVLAHMSEDPNLLEAFRSGSDIHVRTAAEVLGIPEELVGPDERFKAKAVNFGIIYGLSAFGLAKQLGITQRSAKDYIERYFERYSSIRRFIDRTIEETKETGYSRTLFGRCRPVQDLVSRNAMARRFAERIAVNSPIQGTAADLIKKAMVATDEALLRNRLDARLLLQVHDELLIEAPRSEVDSVVELVKREMEAAAELAVPLVVDAKAGPNWRDMERVG